jgi:predicted HTH transcriptional regulator
MKIVNSCKAAGLPTPTLEEDMGGFMVKLFKDRFTEEQLQKLRLNERQVKLEELFQNNIFERIGEDKSTYYKINSGG